LNEAAAEACFARAIAVAQRQRALSWELRAATDLAEFHHGRGRADLARSALAPVYERFQEGAKTADLKRAKSLVDPFTN